MVGNVKNLLNYSLCVIKNEGEIYFVILVVFWLIHVFFGLELKPLIVGASIFYLFLLFFHLVGAANYFYAELLDHEKEFMICEMKYNMFSILPYLIVVGFTFATIFFITSI